ncbi:MAG TPA: hypothetical protein VNX01_06945 [Bacteroidia bacterium]|jgi:hypothetical protein|nr:hypothetical protein [Bacteroidia bacterium]
MKKTKTNKLKKLTGTALICLFTLQGTYAQDNHHDQHGSAADTTKKISKPINKEGFKINFNEDGTHYARINFTSQLWLTDNQNNPGSTVNGVYTPYSYQAALRRTRLTVSSQVTDKVFIFGQIGSDGISSLNGGRNVPLQFLDMTVEYKLLGKWLTVGGGLSGWDGLARYSNPSVPSCLGLDMPLYQQATVNITDNTVRMPGIYAKGKLGKLDYRVAVDIPYATTTNTVIVQTATINASAPNPQFNTSTFAGNKVKPQIQGYFMYQFLDQESNTSAGTVGSYLGQKKVFNIGAGFRYQQNAMWHGEYNQEANPTGTYTTAVKDTVRTNMLLWSVDLFYDAPINKEKGSAVTVYAAYSNFGFGQNYIRNNNPLNPTTTVNANPVNNTGNPATTMGNFNPGLTSFNGAGNQYPMIGTGSIYYAQAGYLLPKFKNGTQFQPYGQFMYANYQALKDPVMVWDIGCNYLIKGHNSKLSLDYQSRPVFNISTTDYQLHDIKSARRGMIVLQYQISF